MSTRQVRWFMVAAVLMAQEAVAAPREAAPPDVDFLEFLGSWNTGDDKWIDPFQEDDPLDVEVDEQPKDTLPRDARDRQGIPRMKTNPPPRNPTPGTSGSREGITP